MGVESFSLDMTTFIHKGEQYVLWAQKTEPADVSDVYIAKMKNPWTLATKPMILTTPEYDWEVQGFKVNEVRRYLSETVKLSLHIRHLIRVGDIVWECFGLMKTAICLI